MARRFPERGAARRRGRWGGGAGAALLLGLGAALASGAERSKDEPIEDAPRMVVRTYNYSPLPGQVLMAAETSAATVLGKAGVLTDWRNCWNHAVEPSGCREHLGPTEITLRILASRRNAPIPVQADALGFALVPAGEIPGVDVGVFYDTVEGLSRLGDASVPQILGHVVAHEIGHLLLGARGHSQSGLMEHHWSRRELQRAAWGRLVFDAEESRLMRAALIARLRPWPPGRDGVGLLAQSER